MRDDIVRKLCLELEARGVTDEEAELMLSAIDDAGLALTDGARSACPVLGQLPCRRYGVSGVRGLFILELTRDSETLILIENRANGEIQITPAGAGQITHSPADPA